MTRSQKGELNGNWRGGISKDKTRYKNKFQAKYPAKAEAHRIISKKIESGALKRQPCEVCGETNDVHAHHDDYTKPLEIRWLCRPHHREWHEHNKPIYKEPDPKIKEQKAKIRRQKIIARAKHCSFCDRADYESFALIAGPQVHICDQCIDLCAEILTAKREAAHVG